MTVFTPHDHELAGNERTVAKVSVVHNCVKEKITETKSQKSETEFLRKAKIIGKYPVLSIKDAFAYILSLPSYGKNSVHPMKFAIQKAKEIFDENLDHTQVTTAIHFASALKTLISQGVSYINYINDENAFSYRVITLDGEAHSGHLILNTKMPLFPSSLKKESRLYSSTRQIGTFQTRAQTVTNFRIPSLNITEWMERTDLRAISEWDAHDHATGFQFSSDGDIQARELEQIARRERVVERIIDRKLTRQYEDFLATTTAIGEDDTDEETDDGDQVASQSISCTMWMSSTGQRYLIHH